MKIDGLNTRSGIAARAVLVPVLAWGLCGAPAFAQNRDAKTTTAKEPKELSPAAKSAVLNAEADAIFSQDRPVEAAAIYTEAYALDPNPAILYNLGRCHQRQGDWVSALRRFEEFRDKAPPSLVARIQNFDGLLEEVRDHVGTLVINVAIPGAIVRVNGAVLPQETKRLPVNSGNINVQVEAPDHEPFQTTLLVAPRKEVTVAPTLVKLAVWVTLRIESATLGSHASVDGKPHGDPPTDVVLRVGVPHLVRVEAPGFLPLERSVVLVEGSNNTVRLDLQKRPSGSVFTKWWFWTGVGVIAAGATVATVYALSNERSAPTGTITPGMVLTSWP
ncbi:MAG: PEGA domain-containing protein [Polyangiaceae bacterium]|nr:PEGA domain-containing protein [Polyangiaceae bacterium]